MNKLILYMLIVSLAIVSCIPDVHAQDEQRKVNLMDFPKKLSEVLGIPLFAGQILASTLFLLMFLLPCAIWAKNLISTMLIGLAVLCFCIAVGWLPFWIILIIALIISALWGSKIKEWIS